MTEVKSHAKVFLFLSSFCPLWLIFFGNMVIKNGFILLNYPINDLKTFSFELGFLIIFIFSLGSTIFFLVEFRKTTNPKKVTDRHVYKVFYRTTTVMGLADKIILGLFVIEGLAFVYQKIIKKHSLNCQCGTCLAINLSVPVTLSLTVASRRC